MATGPRDESLAPINSTAESSATNSQTPPPQSSLVSRKGILIPPSFGVSRVKKDENDSPTVGHHIPEKGLFIASDYPKDTLFGDYQGYKLLLPTGFSADGPVDRFR